MAKEDKSRIKISEIDREICEGVNTVNTPEERGVINLKKNLTDKFNQQKNNVLEESVFTWKPNVIEDSSNSNIEISRVKNI